MSGAGPPTQRNFKLGSLGALNVAPDQGGFTTARHVPSGTRIGLGHSPGGSPRRVVNLQ